MLVLLDSPLTDHVDCFHNAVSSISIYFSIHDFARKLAPRSDAWPIKDQHPRHNRQQSTKSSQKAASALESHRSEHLRCEQGESASQDVTTETLCRERGAGVAVICVRKVVENCKVDAEDAHCCATNAESREYPVVGRERCPPKPKAAHRQEHALDTGEVKAAFGAIEDGALFAGEICTRDVLLRNTYASAYYCRD